MVPELLARAWEGEWPGCLLWLGVGLGSHVQPGTYMARIVQWHQRRKQPVFLISLPRSGTQGD